MTAKRSVAQKSRDQWFGHFAESWAAWHLRLKGYRIIAMRWRAKRGEIDVIARRGDLIVFVEVKARQREADALSAISVSKREKLARAARQWMSTHAQPDHSYRIDAVLIRPFRWPRHIENLFELPPG
jgi:putative endonuclease